MEEVSHLIGPVYTHLLLQLYLLQMILLVVVILNFTDLSTNGPTTWLWDFGDGNTSNLQNPTHTYSVGGIYNVTLTTSNSYGSNTYSIQNYINILDLNYSAISDSSCGSSSLILQTTINNIKWSNILKI